ncbi:hypothetical protein E0Z10_g7576 [Xylaria hypoxylon]|uniref:DUF7907 domain-containing protein n=1 Tax=Xylaria hypoxylon TaxID=37992 RepID=A0A4Z0YUL7_9PEZI|nr:hypothetical protein E0Z10_g7576 [Xylaria hypoxylon]
MHSTALFATSLIGLTSALPAGHEARTASTVGPITGESKGFNLRVNVTDATRDLNPSVQNLYFSDQRVGPGTAISVLGPYPTVFYLNGTAYHTTVTHDIPSVYPLSIGISGPASYDYFYPAEHPIGTSVNGATELSLRPGEPILFPLADYEGGGSYAVCLRDFLFGGSKTQILTARYVYGNETVPADCAPVEFVVECATLPDLPDGSSWNHDSAFDVPCVRD